LDATVDKPGWLEARKLAGRPYASVTAGVAYHDDVDSLGRTALENRENLVRLLNSYITSLITLRDEIDANDRGAVIARLAEASQGRIRWFDERIAAEWLKGEAQSVDAPSFGDRVNQMLFGSMVADRSKRK
jgi:hypothetical protein